MKIPSALFYTMAICPLLFFINVSVWASGSSEKEERSVSGFNSVSFETSGRLILVQGDEEYMFIEGPSKVVRRITAKVRRKTLHIGYRGIFTGRKEEPVITLGVKNLDRIYASGAGDIEAERIEAKNFLVKISSSGGVTINSLDTGTGKILLGSSGDIHIGNGKLSSLEVNINSSGKLDISGESEQLDLKISSSGSFEGGDFRASSAEVELTSSGSAVLWVTDNIEARLSKKCELTYYGTPQLNLSPASEQGTIRAMGDKDAI